VCFFLDCTPPREAGKCPPGVGPTSHAPFATSSLPGLPHLGVRPACYKTVPPQPPASASLGTFFTFSEAPTTPSFFVQSPPFLKRYFSFVNLIQFFFLRISNFFPLTASHNRMGGCGGVFGNLLPPCLPRRIWSFPL